MHAEHEAGETRGFADGLGEFLVGGDAELRVGFVRGGAGQKGAVTSVASGVREFEAADEGEVIPQVRHGLEDGRDIPIAARVRRREIASVHAEAPHGEEGAFRALALRDATRR